MVRNLWVNKINMATKMLSIIIPVYNEEKIAPISLPEIFNLGINKEVIVVDDGSTDNTLAVLQSLKARFDFRLIINQANQGKGAAVKLGLDEVRGDYFIVCDADLEYDPADMVTLLRAAEQSNNGKMVIYGSRFLKHHPFSFHYFINQFLTSLTNWLFESSLTDMETCFKLIPTSALEKIKLNGQRFEIEPEITAQLLKQGYVIRECPISYKRRNYQEGKKIRARDGFLAIKTLFRERFFRRYDH